MLFHDLLLLYFLMYVSLFIYLVQMFINAESWKPSVKDKIHHPATRQKVLYFLNLKKWFLLWQNKHCWNIKSFTDWTNYFWHFWRNIILHKHSGVLPNQRLSGGWFVTLHVGPKTICSLILHFRHFADTLYPKWLRSRATGEL